MSVVNPNRRYAATRNAFSVPPQAADAKTWMTVVAQQTRIQLNAETASALDVKRLETSARETLTVAELVKLDHYYPSVTIESVYNAPEMKTLVRTTRTAAPTTVILELARARRVVMPAMAVPVLTVERRTVEIGQIVERRTVEIGQIVEKQQSGTTKSKATPVV
jgi:hypothetical protein